MSTDDRLSKPDTDRGRLQRAIIGILREHESQPDGLPTSGRFVFYELVQRGVISKKAKEGGRRADQNVADALFFLRDRGVIPWEWIVDETRSLTQWAYGATIADRLIDAADSARLDVWDGAPPPMILTELRSLAGVLNNLAAQYLASIAATNGQVGGFLRTDIAPALAAGQRVLYLGDFDWQGGQIEANTRTVLERLVGELDWERLALTEDQVDQHDLPRLREEDRRYDGDSPHRWHEAVETEALQQQLIVDIVRERLDALLPESLATVQEREIAQRARAVAALNRLKRNSRGGR